MDDYLSAQLARPEVSNRMCRVRTAAELEDAWQQNKHAAILAIEDARILGGELSRMDELARRGVRYLTLQWGGDTCIGGSFDTDNGLTPFGKEVTKRAFALGITPDLSHCSEQSAEDALEIAAAQGKPVIASHSDAFSVNPHRRNLRDRHFEAIRDGGGIVGLNLFIAHLRDEAQGRATVDDVLRHIEHYLALGGEHTITMGGDWDGARLPVGFETIADAQKLADAMAQKGYSETLIQKIFYQNALDFIKRNF
jgi:membrane dipeptidase